MSELEKTYNPSEIEKRLYEKWVKNGYFHAEVDRSKKPFTIVMPPPNITGQLHMGHALDNTMQDILIRMKRMQGYNALWQPGTDHAAIATEVKITEALKAQGIDKADLGREKFLERAWEWKKEYGGRIINQLKSLGSSADWDRERFTMDEGNNKAVNTVFKKLYDKGWIYKGSRIVNWCPVCQTSISDAEVIHEEQQGNFWHIKYPVVGEEGRFVEIATTRPETMLGDTAVAVNPDDERYKDIVGKMLILPLVNKEIPVIADSYVDKEFGTGCVKITPAHDPNDFEVGKRHNLPEINIMNDDATIANIGSKYDGMDRYEARRAIVEDLDKLGLLVKIEPHTHQVGTHDRCKTTVEPLIKPQWFVKMEEMARPAKEAVVSGKLRLVPERMNKVYYNWLDNIRDWCISRQLWWGHRIPAYYCQDCGETVVDFEEPHVCPKCGGTHFKQDEDTLDTWFSSALWPFSTVGWPDTDSEDFKYFFPTDVLVTGYDIIFFWVIRMVFSSIEQTGELPFHTVLFHGLVRDDQGRKMSKSLGNGIDPLEVIEKYGADALRFTLITGNAPGNDMRFYWERVEASRNFANKIWNASRFIMMNDAKKVDGNSNDAAKIGGAMPTNLTAVDRWIISKMNTLVKDVTDNMEKYELGIAADKIYNFLWEEFCDWYIEMVKPRLWDENDSTRTAALYVLKTVLVNCMKLLHPYMPFVTEEIFCSITGEESIMIQPWPVPSDSLNFAVEEKEIDVIKEAVRGVRNIRTEMNVPPSRKANVFVVSDKPAVRSIFEESSNIFEKLAFSDKVTVQADKEGIADDAVSVVIHDAVIYIPLAELVDIEKELERLNKEKARLEGEIKRGEGMLANEKFIAKAPVAKVEEEKAKLVKYKETYEQVVERINALR
ncbi:valyl-tRNA synthetase [Eubacterium ruminantium]|uniref:Valine--tRNA ligase n=1 Tax=Eubacterium ruminantium TaxID=42322 RepID=A0A1T4L4E9_9FIRM|nr:valine--tRNA ligase [Eubacterium ruminantium]SCW43264.1 valyl-tRNA synthetase [Eubacterium ruminantium]SDM80798.1 valyl-tRNA synthetase [Eubacterium ruminantium]SJZ49586.1 valyl-tRNA synthetase [Eubacterium ruminantium]